MIKIRKLYYRTRWHILWIKHFIFKLFHKNMFKYPERYIPDGVYCHFLHINGICPFWRRILFLPEQQNGYCHLLNKTDFEMNPERNKNTKPIYSKNEDEIDKSIAEIYGEYFPTSLLWDQCKECDINYDDKDDE